MDFIIQTIPKTYQEIAEELCTRMHRIGKNAPVNIKECKHHITQISMPGYDDSLRDMLSFIIGRSYNPDRSPKCNCHTYGSMYTILEFHKILSCISNNIVKSLEEIADEFNLKYGQEIGLTYTGEDIIARGPGRFLLHNTFSANIPSKVSKECICWTYFGFIKIIRHMYDAQRVDICTDKKELTPN